LLVCLFVCLFVSNPNYTNLIILSKWILLMWSLLTLYANFFVGNKFKWRWVQLFVHLLSSTW
jgi:hypothetical protein